MPEKGLHDLVEAYNEVFGGNRAAAPDYKLVIVGRADHVKERPVVIHGGNAEPPGLSIAKTAGKRFFVTGFATRTFVWDSAAGEGSYKATWSGGAQAVASGAAVAAPHRCQAMWCSVAPKSSECDSVS